MISRKKGNKLILLSSMRGPRIVAVICTLLIIISALIWKIYEPLFGLLMLAPMMFLGDTDKCILDNSIKKISFIYRKTFKLKPTKHIYNFSEIQDITISRSPVNSENDGYGINFKINGSRINAINNYSLSKKGADRILGEIKGWMNSV